MLVDVPTQIVEEDADKVNVGKGLTVIVTVDIGTVQPLEELPDNV